VPGTADLALTVPGQAAADRHQEALAAYADNQAEWRAAYPAMVSAIIEAYARADDGHRRAGPPLAGWPA
jgi:hypothetical protein